MVVQSLNCVGPIQSSIANGEFVAEVSISGSMVSTTCRAEKSPKCNTIKNGKKGDNTEEPKGTKNSPMQRRTSPRFQANQKVETEHPVCRRVELLNDRDDARDVKKKSTPSKTSGNYENGGKEPVVGKQQRVKNLDESTPEKPKELKESSMQRRTSPRIQVKQKGDKELPVRRGLELPDNRDDAGDVKKKSTPCKRSRNDENVGKEHVLTGQQGDENLDELTAEEPRESKESSVQRRTSARVQSKQKVDKELLVRRRVELLDDREDASDRKKTKRCKRSCNDKNVGKEEVVGGQRRVNKLEESTLLDDKSTNVGSVEVVDSGNGTGNFVDKSDFVKVKETIRLFNKHYLHFVQVSFNVHFVLICNWACVHSNLQHELDQSMALLRLSLFGLNVYF